MAITLEPTKPAASGEVVSEVTEEKVLVASQWQLMWWRFRRHQLAIAGTIVIAIFYILGIFCEFIAPYDPNVFERSYTFVPPQPIHFFHEGEWRGTFIYGLARTRDPETYLITYEPIKDEIYPIHFWVEGDPYKMWGLWRTNIHLFGLDPEADTDGLRIHLLGTDRLGRDMFSRVIYGTRISLSIGLLGIFIQFLLGVLLGGISGYFGGIADVIIQRLIEFLMSLPTIPLWMGLSAALPRDWTSVLFHCPALGVDQLDRAGARGARTLFGRAPRGLCDGRAVAERK
jgi:peptide/nickel transport system permease protein